LYLFIPILLVLFHYHWIQRATLIPIKVIAEALRVRIHLILVSEGYTKAIPLAISLALDTEVF
jgi:hypothetical protein